HTSSGGFFPEWKMLPEKLYFPLKTRWMNEALYVIDPLVNQNKVSVKDKILEINGVAVSDLVEEIYKHIPSQGYIETYKKHQLNKWVEAMIPYALGFPETYEIVVEGENESIELQPVQLFPKSFVEPYAKYCPDRLCLDFTD
ncbi:MAG: peptidase S41, partial [Bacteroidetes bacterium]|nr:peptidase S41 [Bacteroidota bacterium]